MILNSTDSYTAVGGNRIGSAETDYSILDGNHPAVRSYGDSTKDLKLEQSP